MGDYIIGVDIGGTNIRIGAQKTDGKLEKFQKKYIKDIIKDGDPVDALISHIKEYCKNFLTGERIKAISLGLPSTLNGSRDVVLKTANIRGIDNVPLKAYLQKAFDTEIFIERDVNLLYCNDQDVYHLDRDGIAIGIYVGTGIGNAIFIHGRPYVGKNGVAGELGHIPIGDAQKKCGCGNAGCSECYAAGKRLVELKEEFYPNTEIGDIFVKHGDTEEIQKFIKTLAKVIATEINILDPDPIVLGGGVLNMPHFPKEFLEKEIRKHVLKPYPEQTLRFHYSSDEPENGVKGAIRFAMEQMTGE